MKILRNRIAVTLALLALATVAVLYALRIAIAKRALEAEQALRALLGKDASFASVEASLWNGIGFTIKEFHMVDDPLFAATPFVEARALKMGISLWHLAGGRLVVNSLTFFQPQFQIITNETGQLNVAALAQRQRQLVDLATLRANAAAKRSATLSFLVTRLRVIDGAVDFVDRSVVAPGELRIKRIDLDVGGLDLSARAKISLTASLTEALGRDVHIAGEMGPPARGRSWSQQPLNLEMRFDSLSLPTVARALPFLRDHIPKELDITGPMYFHAKLSGTLQQPRLTDVSLKVPLFGSSDYNATLAGSAQFTASRDWANAVIAGALNLSNVSLAQVQNLPVLRQILPSDFVANGSLDVRTRFEGSWNRLRAGILIDAGSGELRFPGWLQKPAGVAADLRAQISRHDNSLVLHPSVVQLADTKLHVSGQLAEMPNARLSMRLRSEQTLLHRLSPLLALRSADSLTGNLRCDLLLERKLGMAAAPWMARGMLNLADVGWRHTPTGRRLDGLTGMVSFNGTSARAENLSFRIGSSPVQATVDIADINRLYGRYTLKSPGLNLMEIAPNGGHPAYLKDVVANGEMTIFGDFPRIQGIVKSAEGNVHNIPYRDLNALMTWSPSGFALKELRAGAFAGTVQASGDWKFAGTETPTVRIVPVLSALSVNEVLRHFSPDFKDRFSGRMDASGEFTAGGPAGASLLRTLKGSGTVSIPEGVVRNFNLIAQLVHHDGARNQNKTSMERPAPALAAIAERQDTPVRDFKTAFTLEAERIRADAISFSTPEYAITGSGWIDMDGAIQWKGNLLMTPETTGELRRRYAVLRYFVDRKGRLAVSFRIDGKLPNVRVRPENRALARVFRWEFGESDAPASEREDRKTNWLSKSLNRLLQR